MRPRGMFVAAGLPAEQNPAYRAAPVFLFIPPSSATACVAGLARGGTLGGLLVAVTRRGPGRSIDVAAGGLACSGADPPDRTARGRTEAAEIVPPAR